MQKQRNGRRIFGCICLVLTVVCIWSGYAVVAPLFLGAIGVAALLD